MSRPRSKVLYTEKDQNIMPREQQDYFELKATDSQKKQEELYLVP